MFLLKLAVKAEDLSILITHNYTQCIQPRFSMFFALSGENHMWCFFHMPKVRSTEVDQIEIRRAFRFCQKLKA